MGGDFVWWRGVLDEVLYGLVLDRPVPDETVEHRADALVAQRMFTQPVENYRDAMAQALDSPHALGVAGDDDAVVRDCLRRLVATLERRRPWPEPAYRQFPAAGREDLLRAPAIGLIPWPPEDVRDVLCREFEAVPGGRGRSVLVLRVASGHEVALTAPPFPETGVVAHAATGDPGVLRADLAALGLVVTAPPPPAARSGLAGLLRRRPAAAPPGTGAPDVYCTLPGCAYARTPRRTAAERFVRTVDLDEARTLVEARIGATADGPYPLSLRPDQPCLTRDWCFVFAWESRAFLASGQAGDLLAGAGPFVVNRDGSGIWQPGSAGPPEWWLDWYGHHFGYEDDAAVRRRLTRARAAGGNP